jgi:hypothetical protein
VILYVTRKHIQQAIEASRPRPCPCGMFESPIMFALKDAGFETPYVFRELFTVFANGHRIDLSASKRIQAHVKAYDAGERMKPETFLIRGLKRPRRKNG